MIGAGGCTIVLAHEVKHSTRSSATGALIVFDRIPIFPLIDISLLAQLLFLLLLCCHQHTVLCILRLQRGNQSCLMRQCLFLLGCLLPRQLQSMRQQRAVTAEEYSHQQQKHQAAAGQLIQPAGHEFPQVHTVFSTSRRVISPFHSLPPAYFQRFSSLHAPAESPAFNFFSIVEPINAYGPTL
ncbi:Uncharacterised protein [Serratia liquefaciens]|nr:Uncharacterised protein [Serratia liquefaciens]CAI1607933.1 Uncharacterised protein [Serratia liquefaciens]